MHTVQLHHLNTSLNLSPVTKSKRVKWMGLLEQSVLLENLEERDQSENLDIDGKLTLKRTLKQDTGVECINFAQNRNIVTSSYVQGCETLGSIKWNKGVYCLTTELLAAQGTLLHGVTRNRIQY